MHFVTYLSVNMPLTADPDTLTPLSNLESMKVLILNGSTVSDVHVLSIIIPARAPAKPRRQGSGDTVEMMLNESMPVYAKARVLPPPIALSLHTVDLTRTATNDTAIQRLASALLNQLRVLILDHCPQITALTLYTLLRVPGLLALSADQTGIELTEGAMDSAADSVMPMTSPSFSISKTSHSRSHSRSNSLSSLTSYSSLRWLSIELSHPSKIDSGGVSLLLSILPTSTLAHCYIRPLSISDMHTLYHTAKNCNTIFNARAELFGRIGASIMPMWKPVHNQETYQHYQRRHGSILSDNVIGNNNTTSNAVSNNGQQKRKKTPRVDFCDVIDDLLERAYQRTLRIYEFTSAASRARFLQLLWANATNSPRSDVALSMPIPMARTTSNSLSPRPVNPSPNAQTVKHFFFPPSPRSARHQQQQQPPSPRNQK